MSLVLTYTLQFDLKRHHILVQLEIPEPDPNGQAVHMAAWAPGSYLARDFARHVLSLSAFDEKGPVSVSKVTNSLWKCASGVIGKLCIEYKVYAFERSIRGAYVDHTHIFFEGARIFLEVVGQRTLFCNVLVENPQSHWSIVTAMPVLSQKGPAWYCAKDYEELIDHPFEIGTFETIEFMACNTRHFIHLSGRHYSNCQRLAADVRAVCTTIIEFFGKPAPMSEYHFLLDVLSSGYGGLEHRASTAMVCCREDLPANAQVTPANYRTLLGLFSHEYFHTWWIKRVKPKVFIPYDLTKPILTELLWVFEGFTAYYDDLLLTRAKVVTAEHYLEVLGQSITKLQQTPGRLFQPVTESSIDAWIKFYKPDENTPNAAISYYAKGSMIGLCLDLKLRAASDGRHSLDNICRRYWQEYLQTGAGLEEDAIPVAVRDLGYPEIADWLEHILYTTTELPFAECLALVGIQLNRGPVIYEFGGQEALKPREEGVTMSLGMRLETKGTEVSVAHVLMDSPAMESGISAGDVLVALDGLRVTKQSYLGILTRLGIGQSVQAQVFRDDVLLSLTLLIPSSQQVAIKLKLDPTASDHAIGLRKAWLAQL